jgi:hypothetical protein
VAPAGAAALALTSPSTYAYGSWVEFIASASGAVYAAGLTFPAGTWASHWHEIEIGIGAAAAEAAVMRFQVFSPNSGSGYPRVLLWPAPVLLGPAGSRVAIRVRRNGSGATVSLCLLYYQDLVTEHVSTVPLAGAPTAAVGVSITGNATPWAWSAWGELTTGFASEVAITGITPSNPVASIDVEWELGVGGAGAEVGITRFRAATSTAGAGMWRVFTMAAPHPVAAGTRIAARFRKAGTSTTAHQVQLLYLDGTALL